MKNFKKILFPIFSLFLIYRSIELIKNLLSADPGGFNGAQSLFVAFLLTLFITGIFAFPGFVYPTHKLVPASYYRIRRPKRLNRIYRVLGIHYFRYLLLLFFWGHKKNRKKYFDGTRSGLKNFVFQSKQSEFGHLAALLSIFILSLTLLYYQYYKIVLIVSVINLIGNFYPILLQRYHRIRIDKILIMTEKRMGT